MFTNIRSSRSWFSVSSLWSSGTLESNNRDYHNSEPKPQIVFSAACPVMIYETVSVMPELFFRLYIYGLMYVQGYLRLKRLPVLQGILEDHLVQKSPTRWTGIRLIKTRLHGYCLWLSAWQQIFSFPKTVFVGESVNWSIAFQTETSHCTRWPVIQKWAATTSSNLVAAFINT